MCIIIGAVDRVSNTKIACFTVGYSIGADTSIKPAQLVVYAAHVDSVPPKNAFVLPVYNPGNDINTIIPLDLSKHPNFFDTVDKIFDYWYPKKPFTNAIGVDGYNPLPVHKVGDYSFSIMPTKGDFHRLNKSVLNVDVRALASIDVHNNDYSFVVYQFTGKGSVKVTPFGYICPTQNENLVVPTIHGHPEDVRASLYYQTGRVIDELDTRLFHDTADFDHTVYATVRDLSGHPKRHDVNVLKSLNQLLKSINRDYRNRIVTIRIPNNFVPHKIKISGEQPNRNILITPDVYSFLEDIAPKGKVVKYSNSSQFLMDNDDLMEGATRPQSARTKRSLDRHNEIFKRNDRLFSDREDVPLIHSSMRPLF